MGFFKNFFSEAPTPIVEQESPYSADKMAKYIERWKSIVMTEDRSYAGNNSIIDGLLKNIAEQAEMLSEDDIKKAYKIADLDENYIRVLDDEIAEQNDEIAESDKIIAA